MKTTSRSWGFRVTIILVQLAFGISAFAQVSGSISVQVVDAETQVPVRYAKVSLIEIRGPAAPMPDPSQTAFLPLVRTCGTRVPWCFFEAEKIEVAVRTKGMLVLAQSEGYAFAARRIVRSAKPATMTMRLKPPIVVEGVVRTQDGVPVNSAEVGIVYDDQQLNWATFGLPYGGVLTNEDGSFSTLASADYPFAVEVFHERFLPVITLVKRWAQAPRAIAPAPIEITLAEGAVVSGRVLDSQERALAGLRVILSSKSRTIPLPKSRAFARALDRETVSAADGSFVFRGVGSGEFSITVGTSLGTEAIKTLHVDEGDQSLMIRLPHRN
ncbi:MAG TPA: carboxypeptidase-like regulatory domain-containing protein [Acidobacteriota bacterium]|nr:carboxypeptidase-like regulatory domain-containing protein [Acidobacteriota bacterium]